MLKRCRRCHVKKELNLFPARGHICKVCKVVSTKKWMKENKEKRQKYLEKNKDKINKCVKEYRKANKEKIDKYVKEYRKANKEKILKYGKKWREENKIHTAEYRRDYYKNEKNKTTRNKRVRIYGQKPEERIKSKCRAKTHVLIKKGILIKKPCEKCGEIIVEAHHADYSKPELVNWLCPNHHRELHSKLSV